MSKHKPLTLYVNVNKASQHVNPISFEQENVYRASDVKSEDAEIYISARLVGEALFKMENCSCPFSDDPNGVARWITETAKEV